jgi:quinol monooxygenase YgiN
MSFVNCVSIRAKAGCEQTLEDVFEDLTVSTRHEPGCITYQLHRSLHDPLHYFVYECYVDESAYRFHQSTAHFSRVVKGIIPSLVEGREITQYRLIY